MMLVLDSRTTESQTVVRPVRTMVFSVLQGTSAQEAKRRILDIISDLPMVRVKGVYVYDNEIHVDADFPIKAYIAIRCRFSMESDVDLPVLNTECLSYDANAAQRATKHKNEAKRLRARRRYRAMIGIR
jgi:3-polyprenyl-4-hydroxybenzoate decarboxylase